MTTINVNGKEIEVTKIETTSGDISLADFNKENEDKSNTLDNEKAAILADAKVGNDKLINLGLTQNEVTAMTGYTPPIEDE